MTAKRILSLFMALVLTLCTACITATAQSAQVTAATALINALPDPSTITDADSEAYAKAVADAWEAVYALAECSEEEMMDISDFNKPFDMLFQLWLLPADLANAPTAIPASEEEVFAQAPWLFNASDVLNALPDGYSTLNAYTSTDDQGNQLGTVLLEQLVACY